MIIAVASGKGGTGKSTITLNLAGTLAAKKNRVFIVDADPQGSIATWAKHTSQQEPTVIVNPTPALGKKTRKAVNQYDMILFDAPPTFKRRMRAVLEVADRLIIPVAPGMADFWSTEKLIDMYLEAREKRPKLDARLLISRIDRRTKIGKNFRPFLEKLNMPVFMTEIAQRSAYAETWMEGVTIDKIGGAAAAEMSDLADEVIRWMGSRWRV